MSLKEVYLIALSTVLLVTFVLSLFFKAARWVCLACFAGLLLFHPIGVLLLLMLGGAVVLFILFR